MKKALILSLAMMSGSLMAPIEPWTVTPTKSGNYTLPPKPKKSQPQGWINSNNSRTIDGETPLIFYARLNNTKCALSMISRGANIHAESNKEKIALNWAITHKNQDLIDALVTKGAKSNRSNPSYHCERDSYNQTRLIRAARNNRPSALEFAKTDNVHARSFSNETALYWAAAHQNTKLVQVLLEKGANPLAKSDDLTKEGYHRTPYWWAKQTKNKDIQKLMWKKMPQELKRSERTPMTTQQAPSFSAPQYKAKKPKFKFRQYLTKLFQNRSSKNIM